MLKFLAIRDGVVLGFVIATFNLRIKILIGGYSMAAGYITALISIVSRIVFKGR